MQRVVSRVTFLSRKRHLVNCSIVGLGCAVPPLSISRDQSGDVAKQLSCQTSRQADKLDALYRRSGVQQRGSVLLGEAAGGGVDQVFFPAARDDEDRGPTTAQRSQQFADHAPALAERASCKALAQAGVEPSAVTHLITVTCTGFNSPGIDIELIDRLGLSPTTQRIQVGFMGCHGAINGLRTARGLVAAEPNAVVLVCCVELCSLHYQYGYDANRIVSGALFADGAAGMVVRNQPSDTDSSGVIADVQATGSCLVADSRDAMTWKIGDYGFEMTLAATVPSLIEAELHEFLSGWLSKNGTSIEAIQGWAVHPGGRRILTAVEKALSLSSDDLADSREVLAQHGNMSSATMPTVLERFVDDGRDLPWVMLGFGPGLEIEVALLR